MSVRTRDNSVLGSDTRSSRNYNSNGVLTDSGQDSISWRNADLMVDTVTPGFLGKRQQGIVVNNAMHQWKTSGRTVQRPVTILFPPDRAGKRARWETSAYWVGPAAPPSNPNVGLPIAVVTAMERLESLALTEAYAKVGAPDISALVSMAELPETLAFLWSPIKSALSLTRRGKTWLKAAIDRQKRYEAAQDRYWRLPERIRARRQPPKKPKNPPFKVGNFSATDISSFWLAYRYGLMPLIYEFQAWEKVLTQAWKTVPRATARGKASDVVEVTLRDTTTAQYHDSRNLDTLRAKVDVRAGVLYEPLVEWTNRFGLQLNRVPAAMYELIPLSFVADWAWNGAEVYDALTASCRSQQILTAWCTSTVTYEYTTSRTLTRLNAGYTAQGTGGVCYSEEGVFKRRRPTSMQDVRLHLRIEMNAKRIADGLALIHQFLSTGKRK